MILPIFVPRWQPWIALTVFLWQICKSGCRPDKKEYRELDEGTIIENFDERIHKNAQLDKWDYGRLQLILSGEVDRLLEEAKVELEDIDRLSDLQTNRLRHKLKGLYSQLMDHPALLQRRLYVGSKKPNIPPPSMEKRGFELELEQPVCPSRTDWVRLKRARDINDTEVEVFQPALGSKHGQQWFYTNTCSNNSLRLRRDCPGCCIGIAHDRFLSSCRQKTSYVMALVRRPSRHLYDWNWIQINTSCNCAIVPKRYWA